jgi:hypothetical protein
MFNMTPERHSPGHSRLAAGFALLALFAGYGTAHACSCLAFPADEAEAAAMAYPQADAVFVGRVTDIKSGVPGMSRFRQVYFDVDKAWKGVTDDSGVVVRTAANSAACGYPFNRGETYLVFAFRNPKDGSLSTNLCTLNRPAARASGLMRELDELAAAEAAPPLARAGLPGDCAAMLATDDVFEYALPATRQDAAFFDSYVGEFHSDRLTFDDGETEYYFALRYDWFDEGRTTLEYSASMVIPGQDRKVLRSKGFYGYDPFGERIYVAGASRQFGLSFAVLEHSDPGAGERRMLGRLQRPDGNVTLVSDQFEWIDADTFRNRAFVCTSESADWSKVYEGVYTRIAGSGTSSHSRE